jgi:hypothetical protein
MVKEDDPDLGGALLIFLREYIPLVDDLALAQDIFQFYNSLSDELIIVVIIYVESQSDLMLIILI